MNKKSLYNKLEEVGRIQLSDNFFMREFLSSEIATAYGIVNLPGNLDLAVEAGTNLCEKVLEPIQKAWGRIHIRSAYRSEELNRTGNINKLNCSTNEKNYAGHIWDVRDAEGYLGATACIVLPAFLQYFHRTGEWASLAWWIHHHVDDYAGMCFFKNNCAFNINWNEKSGTDKTIDSFISNPDTGDRTRILSKGKIHSYYESMSPDERFKNAVKVLKQSKS